MGPIALMVTDAARDHGWGGCCCLLTEASVGGVGAWVLPLDLGPREQDCPAWDSDTHLFLLVQTRLVEGGLS